MSPADSVEAGAPIGAAEERPTSSLPNALSRLVPFAWRGELLLIYGGMVASFVVAGFWYPYWRVADMDFWIVYNAFLLNAGLPQEYFDHPGYLSILLLSEWLRGLHALGLLKVAAFSTLPPLSEAAAFNQAWTAATQAARVLSLLIAIGFVLTFAALLRVLIKDWRVASLATFFLAFSGGMAMQMRIMRTELLAAGLFMIALLILLIVARRGPQLWRPALMGLASGLIVLALMNKIQVLFLICALPVLVLPFGPATGIGEGGWQSRRLAWPVLVATAAAATIALYLAWDFLVFGLTTPPGPPALRLSAPVYWTLIAFWLAGGMIVYCLWWRTPKLEALTAMLAIVAGGAAALLALKLRYHPYDVRVVFHPLEQMADFVFTEKPDLAAGGLVTASRLDMLFDCLRGLIARRTFFLHTSPRPTIFLEWAVIAGAVLAWRQGERRTVYQVAVLMLTVWAVDLLGVARGLKQEYFLLTDPLVVIAGALLLAQVQSLQAHRWTYAVGAALIAAHVAFSQAEPVKHMLSTEGPQVLCDLYHHARRVERLPVCKS